jgi:glycerol kinase
MERMTSTTSHQPQYVLALDQGTSSSRAILFDHAGNVVRIAQREFRQYYPHPGHVEHDPYEIWQSQLAVAHEVLGDANVSGTQLPPSASRTSAKPRCCGTARPASRWAARWSGRTAAPRRCARTCRRRATARHSSEDRPDRRRLFLRHQTALDARQLRGRPRTRRARRAGLRHRRQLADLAADRRRAARHRRVQRSRTLLFNIHDFRWDDELLGLLDIPRSLLPEVAPSSGEVAHASARLFGVEIPIAGIAGDQQAATFGQACLRRAWPRTPMAPAASS